MPESKVIKGYCMKCKQSRVMVNTKRIIMKNKRPACKGECKKCGTSMFKIVKKGE